MSLVNEMLQDLQQRKAAGSKPLTGLRAVPTPVRPTMSPDRNYRWLAVVSVPLIVAVVAIGWRAMSGVGNRITQIDTTVAELPSPRNLPKPVVPAATDIVLRSEIPVLERLKTNRMDYSLESVSRLFSSRPVSAKQPVSRQAAGQSVVKKTTPVAMPSVTPVKTAAISAIKPVTNASRLRRDGLKALRAGRPQAAELQFAQLVMADRKNAEVYLYLHAALQAQSRTTEARNVLNDGLQHATETAQLAQVLAHELLADGRVDNALAILTTHRPPGHNDLEYEARLAAVNQRAGQHAVAADLYQQLVNKKPANGAWWVGLAISQEAQGNPQAAARSFARATAAGTLNATLARYATDRLNSLETGS